VTLSPAGGSARSAGTWLPPIRARRSPASPTARSHATLTAVAADGRIGPASAPSDPATPTSSQPSPPARVATLKASAVNGGVTVVWDPPASDGGSPVQRYRSPPIPGENGAAPWGVHFATLSTSLGTSYTISVQAVTDAAFSEPVTSSPVQLGPAAPVSPTRRRRRRSPPRVTAPGRPPSPRRQRRRRHGQEHHVHGGARTQRRVGRRRHQSDLAPPKAGAPTQVSSTARTWRRGQLHVVVVAWNGRRQPSLRPVGPRRVPATTSTTAPRRRTRQRRPNPATARRHA